MRCLCYLLQLTGRAVRKIKCDNVTHVYCPESLTGKRLYQICSQLTFLGFVTYLNCTGVLLWMGIVPQNQRHFFLVKREIVLVLLVVMVEIKAFLSALGFLKEQTKIKLSPGWQLETLILVLLYGLPRKDTIFSHPYWGTGTKLP